MLMEAPRIGIYGQLCVCVKTVDYITVIDENIRFGSFMMIA